MDDKTIQILRNTLEKNPDLWDTRQHLAELLWAAGDVQGTADILSATPEWPEDEANLEFAASVFAHTDPVYSIELYKSVTARNQGNPRAHAALARLYMETDERELSKEHFLAANAIDPAALEPHVTEWHRAAEAPAETEIAGQVADEAVAAAPEPEVEAAPQAESAPEKPEMPLAVPDPKRFPSPAPSIGAGHKKNLSAAEEVFSLANIDSRLEHAAHEAQDAELANSATKKRTASLIVAGLVHVVIGVLLYFWILHDWKEPPVMIVSTEAADPGEPKIQKQTFTKSVRRKPNPASSSARAQIITTNVAMPIAVEEIEEVDPNAFGVAKNFGSGLGFGDGDGGGGSVMFFGDSAQVSRAVFIVDFSGSMNRGSRITQLKKELDASLSKLPAGVSYNIIYYSHRPWLGGENVGSAPFRDWENPADRIPWLKATKENIQRSREQVASMTLGGATNWIPPVRMALAMTPKPNVIWLLTDGEATDREEMIVNMAEINPSNVRINTIGMEIGGPTFESLIEIAEITGGKYSIVMGGQLYTGSAARKFTDPQYSPQN